MIFMQVTLQMHSAFYTILLVATTPAFRKWFFERCTELPELYKGRPSVVSIQ